MPYSASIKAIVLCGCYFFNLLSQSVWAQSNTLIVALTDTDYPPYYIEQKGELTGISLEIVTYIANDLNLKLQFQKYPWARAIHLLKNGKVDLMIHLSKTAAREQYITYTEEPHICDNVHVVVRRNSAFKYAGNLNQLTPFLIGVVRDVHYGDAFDQPGLINKKAFNNEKMLLNELVNGTVDFIVGNPFSLLTHAKRMKLDAEISIQDAPLHQDLAYFGFSKKHPKAEQFAQEFSLAIKRLKQSFYYSELLNRYFDGSY